MTSSLSTEIVKSPAEGGCYTNKNFSEDKESLGSILVSAIIQSQQEGSETSSAFQVLLDHLKHSSLHQTSMLAGNPQFQHYLHRLVRSEAKYARDDNIAKLAVHFPDAVSRFQGVQLPFSYSYSDIPSMCDGSIHKKSFISGGRKAHVRRRPATVGVDTLYSYNPVMFPVTFTGPQVKLSNLSTAILSVDSAMKKEHRTRDGYHTLCVTRGAPLGKPSFSRRVMRKSSYFTRRAKLVTRDMEEKPQLSPVLMKDVDDSHFRISKSGESLFPQKKPSKKHIQITSSYLHGIPLHSAQDVIEAFASEKFGSETEFVYLNYTNPDKWCPYDLTVVPKTKVRPEHFIMTKFGIILVTLDGTSTFQMFSDWLKEASLFTLVRQIKFFKEFKIRKALKHWFQTARHLRYRRLCAKINKMAIRFLPTFSDALFQLKHLSDELLTVSFHNLKPLGGYTLQTLELQLGQSQAKACHLLNKYFKYSKRLVCRAITITRSHALEFSMSRSYHSSTISDVPISIQQENLRIRKRDLKTATYHVYKLDCFVELAEQMVCDCLIQLTQRVVDSWKEVLLCQDSILRQASSGFQISIRVPSASEIPTSAPSTSVSLASLDRRPDYFLFSSMVFNEFGELTLEPSTSRFVDLLSGFYHNVLAMISTAVYPLDGSPNERTLSANTKRTWVKYSKSTLSEDSNKLCHKKTTDFLSAHDSIHQELTGQGLPSLPSLSRKPYKLPLKSLKDIPQEEVVHFFKSGTDMPSHPARSQPTMPETLTVGESSIKRRTLLSTASIIDTLKKDEHIESVMEDLVSTADKVYRNLESILQDHGWIEDVWRFIQTRKAFNRKEIMKIDLVQSTLQKLHGWYNKLQALPPELLGPYSIVCVSISELVRLVLPKLLSMQYQIQLDIINKAQALCGTLLRDIKEKSEIISLKRYDLEGFSQYAHMLRKSGKFCMQQSSNVVYVKKILDTLTQLEVDIPPEHKEMEKELQAAWQDFQVIIEDGNMFVAKQRPIKAQGLQENIQGCEEDIWALVEPMYHGKFVDPSQSPSKILDKLVKMKKEVALVRSRLLELSKWKDDITGSPHDLSSTQSLVNQIYYHQELWKYRRVFDSYDDSWKNSPFKNLDIDLIAEKVSEWLGVSSEFETLLPKQHPVLMEWRQRLDSLQEAMPLFQQLASKNLKASHWTSIFAAIGENYDGSKQYTFTDFSLLNISGHSGIIFEICHDAMQQDKLTNQIQTMLSALDDWTLIATPILLQSYPFALSKTDPSQDETASKKQSDILADGIPSKKNGVDKLTSFAVDVVRTSLGDPGHKLYRVVNLAEIYIDLEHRMTRLKMIITSSHLGSLKAKGDDLLDTFSQLLEIVSMLTECQTKWDQMLNLFDSIIEDSRDDYGLANLQEMTATFQEITKSICDDPRLLSLLSRKRGQKGFRDFQGEALRRACTNILSLHDSIVIKVENWLKKQCEKFPRLCSLPAKDIISAACNRGDPLPMVPIINKVFPAIRTLGISRSAAPSIALNCVQSTSSSKGFQVTSVKGWFDESLSLSGPLALEKRSGTEWLSALEYAISYSLGSALNETYSSLPECLKGIKITDDVKVEKLVHWLDGHLNQCVLVAMELHWTATIHDSLVSAEPIEQLKQNRMIVCAALKFVCGVLLKRHSKWSQPTDLLLQHLALLLRHKSNTIQSLLSEKSCIVESFRWRAQLLYSTDDTDRLYTMNKNGSGAKGKVSALDERGSSTSSDSASFSKPRSICSTLDARKSSASSSDTFSFDSMTVHNNPSKLNVSSMVSQKESTCLPLRTFVHCYESALSYGFEFLGASAHLCLTPQTEASLLSLVQAVGNRVSPLVNTAHCPSSQAVPGKDLSIALGAHFYAVECSLLSDATVLRRLLCGSVHAGSILQLDNFHQLPYLLQVSLGRWLRALSCALPEESYHYPTTMHSESTKSTQGPGSVSTSSVPSTTPTFTSKQDSRTFSSQSSRQRLLACQSFSSNMPECSSITPQFSNATTNERSRSSSSRAAFRMDWYQFMAKTDNRGFGYGGGTRSRYVEMDGDVLKVSPIFGCVLVGDASTQPLPEPLKSCFRPVHMPQPDLSYLAESLLASHGFTGATALGRSLAEFQQQLKHQLSSCDPMISSSLGLSTLKRIIGHAAACLMDGKDDSSRAQDEGEAIVHSVLHFFGSQLTSRAASNGEEEGKVAMGSSYLDLVGWTKLRELLEGYFPSCDPDPSSSFSFPVELENAIKMELKERHLQCLPALIEKVQQLHHSLAHSKCIILTGPCGSGKSTCYNILNAAYEHVQELQTVTKQPSDKSVGRKYEDKERVYPFVNISVFNPRLHTLDELFGCHVDEPVNGGVRRMWKDGILTTAIRRIESYNNTFLMCSHRDGRVWARNSNLEQVVHWLVLDGPIQPALNQALCHLTADEGMTLGNGETLSLPPFCKLIIETLTLDHATPCLAWYTVVHCSREIISTGALVDTWLDRVHAQHNLSAACSETLAVLINQVLPDTLAYLVTTNTHKYGEEYSLWRNSQVHGMAETQCFLSLLSAVLARNAPKMEDNWSRSCSRSSRATSRSGSRPNSQIFSASMTSLQSDDLMGTNLFLGEEVSLSKISNPDTEFSPSDRVHIASMLSFAYIWSLGAFVPFSEVQSFNELARDQILQLPYAVPLPDKGSVFDYFLDKTFRFIPWAEIQARPARDVGGGYIAVPEVSRIAYIADLYLSCGFNVIFVGDRGTGKTSFINYLMRRHISVTRVAVTPDLTPLQLRTSILDKLAQWTKEHRQRQRMSKMSTTMPTAVYLDDLHLAYPCNRLSLNFGSSLLEMVRYLLQHHKIADPLRSWYESNLNFKYLASSTPDGYWRLPVRLTRGTCVLPFLPPSDECLYQMFSQSLRLWLSSFSFSTGNAKHIANALSAASVTVYRSVVERFVPSSSHPHYLINMHDLLNMYKGLLLLSPDAKAQVGVQPQFCHLHHRELQSCSHCRLLLSSQKKSGFKPKSSKRGIQSLTNLTGKTKVLSRKKPVKDRGEFDPEMVSTLRMMIRVWCHESTRVYLDRRSESKDHVWFLMLLESCIKHCFCGVGFGGDLPPKDRQATTGRTAGSRRVRGSRARRGAGVGNTQVQGSQSVAGLNEKVLAADGVKVGTLKNLMKVSSQAEGVEAKDGRSNEDFLPKLIALEQVTLRGEDLTGLIFAQFPDPCSPVSSPVPDDSSQFSSGAESHSTESLGNRSPSEIPGGYLTRPRPYAELGDGQVIEILSKHLHHFQTACNSKSGVDILQSSYGEIVLFREAIEHCARLYRVMNLLEVHALLLGTEGIGRKSLIRLMAYIMQSNLIDADKCCTRVSLRKCLRSACMSATVENQSTILVISNHCQISFAEWKQVIQLMNEGLPEGLFTTSEILMMSAKLETGGGVRRNTVQAATRTFCKAVCAQLHVFVLWNTDSVTDSLFTESIPCEGACGLSHEASRNLFQALYRSCSYVDQYRPWSKNVYSDIAIMWWQRESSTIKWQDWVEDSSRLEAIAGLAAHIHITTTQMLIKSYGSLARLLLSPMVLIKCLAMTQHIAVGIKTKEKTIASKLQAALSKFADVDQVVSDLECEIFKLKAELAAAEVGVHQKMKLITTAKERYMEANRKCKHAKETIECEAHNMQQLKVQLDQQFSQVADVYQGALEALSSVKAEDIGELMSYRKPPSTLFPVFDALCMMFDRDENWEECKVLLMSHKFINSLKFFDRDHVPQDKLRRLDKMVSNILPSKLLKDASYAVISISRWLNGLVDYHRVTKSMEPVREQLKEAEKALNNADVVFATLKHDMVESKAALENTAKLHKESIKKARAVEAQIDALKSKQEEAQNILATTANQRKKWEEQLRVSCNRLDSVPGHAMLCAASAYYLSRTPPDLHKELIANWLAYCSGAVSLGSVSQDGDQLQAVPTHGAFSGKKEAIQVQKDFSVANHFSERQERALWEKENSFPDGIINERCLCTRALGLLSSSSWPLVFDPYHQFEGYLRALNGSQKDSDDLLLVTSSDRALAETLRTAVTDRRTVLLSVHLDRAMTPASEKPSSKCRKFLSRLLRKDLSTFTSTSSKDDSESHASFQLYLVVFKSIKEVLKVSSLSPLGPALGDFSMRSILGGSIVDLEFRREALECHLLRLVTTLDKPEYLVHHKSLLTDLVMHKQQLEEEEEHMLESMIPLRNESPLLSHDLLSCLREKEASEVALLDQIRETNKLLEAFDRQVKVYQPLAQFASAVLRSLQKLSSIFLYFSSSIDEFEQVLTGLMMRFRSNKLPNNTMSINAYVLYLKNQLLLSVYKHLQAPVLERHQLLIPLLVELELELETGRVASKEVEQLCSNLGGLATELEDVEVKVTMYYKEPHRVSDEMVSTMTPVSDPGERCPLIQKLLLWKTFCAEKFHVLARHAILVSSGADFIVTKSPSLDEIVELTGPHAVTLLLQPPCRASMPSLESIRDAGSKHNVDVKHFPLDTQESCDKIVAGLASFACEKCWLVVENCHLMDSFLEVLADMNKELAGIKVHSDFRALFVVPVECLAKHSSISTCYKVVFQTPDILDEAHLSRLLLQDLSRYAASGGHALSLDLLPYSHASSSCEVLAKLQSFLPKPLTAVELKVLDLRQHRHHQVMAYLIYEELWLHDRAVVQMHASLCLLLGFLRGKVMFSTSVDQMLTSLWANEIPRQWCAYLPRPLGHVTCMTSAVKLLRSRLTSYRTTLQSGSSPPTLHPLLLSNPVELFSRLAGAFATCCKVDRSAVLTEVELIEPGSPSDRQEADGTSEDSIVIHSLTLHNTTWDHVHKCLLPPTPSQQDHISHCSAIISFKVRQYDDDTKNIYNCPLLLDARHSWSGRPAPVLFHLPLPTSSSVEEVAMTEVHLACDAQHDHI